MFFFRGEISLFFQKEIGNILEISGVNLINFLFFWLNFAKFYILKYEKKQKKQKNTGIRGSLCV